MLSAVTSMQIVERNYVQLKIIATLPVWTNGKVHPKVDIVNVFRNPLIYWIMSSAVVAKDDRFHRCSHDA